MPTPRKVFIGQVYSTSHGDCKVLSFRARRVTVEFVKTGTVKETNSGNLLTGKVKDPYYPNIFGIGYFGEGTYNLVKHRKFYVTWWNMLKRVYVIYPLKGSSGKVCKRWHNFQNFCADVSKMPNCNNSKFDLDKDLRVLGNKSYGPNFCSFVPYKINTLLIFPKNKRNLPLGIQRARNKYAVYSKVAPNKSFSNLEDAQRYYCVTRVTHTKIMAERYKKYLHKEVYDTLVNIQPEFFIQRKL